MAGRTDLKSSTLINVVDLSLIEFQNDYVNQEIRANKYFTQPGDSGYPLWRTDQECKYPYQVSLRCTMHMLIAHTYTLLYFSDWCTFWYTFF